MQAQDGDPLLDTPGSGPMAQINVTPLVDVMLVLLIVFMVAAPLMASGVPVNLPRAQSDPVQVKTAPVVVSIDREGKVFVGSDETSVGDLAQSIRARRKPEDDGPILVRGDGAVAYQRVMEVMTAIGAAGIGRVALVTDAPKPNKEGAQ